MLSAFETTDAVELGASELAVVVVAVVGAGADKSSAKVLMGCPSWITTGARSRYPITFRLLDIFVSFYNYSLI